MSNISVPNNFISLAPPPIGSNVSAGTQIPFIVGKPRKKEFAALADEHFPEALWNIGGVFLYDNVRLVLCDFCNGGFDRSPAIAETHGAPPCVWTLEWFQSRPLIPPAQISARLKEIADKRATAFVLYLDNPFVSEKMLGDSIGNTLLNYARQMPQASVSVASELLAGHIRKTFPTLRLRAGVNKVIAENGRGNADYYFAAAEKFSVVALHPDDAFDLALAEKLAKIADKIEITVNDTCLRRCALREQHLATLAKIRENPWSAEPLRERHALLAEAKCEETLPAGSPLRANLLTRKDLEKLYALGFRRFRIQAETLRSEISFFWQTLRWLFSDKPENLHYFGLIASSLITRIKEPVPVIPTGLAPFVKRKYD